MKKLFILGLMLLIFVNISHAYTTTSFSVDSFNRVDANSIGANGGNTSTRIYTEGGNLGNSISNNRLSFSGRTEDGHTNLSGLGQPGDVINITIEIRANGGNEDGTISFYDGSTYVTGLIFNGTALPNSLNYGEWRNPTSFGTFNTDYTIITVWFNTTNNNQVRFVQGATDTGWVSTNNSVTFSNIDKITFNYNHLAAPEGGSNANFFVNQVWATVIDPAEPTYPILDFESIFVNELVGDSTLFIILLLLGITFLLAISRAPSQIYLIVVFSVMGMLAVLYPVLRWILALFVGLIGGWLIYGRLRRE